MKHKAPVETARAGQASANVQGKELLESHPDIAIVGPRGTAQGDGISSWWRDRA